MALAVYTLIHVVAFPLFSLLLMYFVLFDPLEFTPLSFMFPNLEAKFSLCVKVLVNLKQFGVLQGCISCGILVSGI